MRTRRALDRAAVVEAAADLLDETGGRELTLAMVAKRLGVRAPSLYNHIEGLEELRHEVALLGVRELGVRIGRAAIGKAGKDALRSIAWAYRDFAKERPGLYLATLRAPDPDDRALEAAAEEILTILRLVLAPYELSPEDQIHTIRALRSVMHGFVSLELAGGFGLPVDLDESFDRLITGFIASLRR